MSEQQDNETEKVDKATDKKAGAEPVKHESRTIAGADEKLRRGTE
jgi:hypothetical protein